jgi:hypothetical protein
MLTPHSRVRVKPVAAAFYFTAEGAYVCNSSMASWTLHADVEAFLRGKAGIAKGTGIARPPAAIV